MIFDNPNKPQKSKMSYKQKEEFKQIEKDMPKLEEQKETLSEKINACTGNYEELAKLSKQIEELNQKLEEKEMRWLELSELE